MKAVMCLAAVFCLSAAMLASEPGDADKKWCGVVEKMIVDGASTISTPSENRVKLARELATRHGRECQVEKTQAGYKVTFLPAKVASK